MDSSGPSARWFHLSFPRAIRVQHAGTALTWDILILEDLAGEFGHSIVQRSSLVFCPCMVTFSWMKKVAFCLIYWDSNPRAIERLQKVGYRKSRILRGKNKFFHLRAELYSRVVCGGWDCSHSIRSEILLRSWCPDFFFNFFKKYFFDRSKKKVRKFSKKWKKSIFSIFPEIFKKVEKIQRKSILFFFEKNRFF